MFDKKLTKIFQKFHWMSSTKLETTCLVLGSGNFGTCLAYHLANERLNNNVVIYSRDEFVSKTINEERYNPKYLKQFKLRDKISAVSVIDKELMKKVHVILVTIPTQHFRKGLKLISEYITKDHLLILANKGIETDTLDLPYEILKEVLGKDIAHDAVYLSGPSFAIEVMNQEPTCVTVASSNKSRAEWAQEVFHDPYFRVYTSDDVIGVETAGALKNVIAIASGMCSGMGFQLNTRAALLTRGLHEITKIGVKLGANPLTFLGLSGVGDLFLTCSSEKSRNFTVGYRLGKGEKLDKIIETLGSVSEGVPTTKAAYLLSKKLQTSTPIIDEIYKILYEDKDLKTAIYDLLTIEAQQELKEIEKHK